MLFFIGIFWVHVRLKITNFVEFRLCYLQAVDVVGQAGKPKTITGFQTHTTPVLLAYGERAELATEECILLTSSEKIWLAKVCACVRVVCLGINHRRSISCDILSCTSLRAYPVTQLLKSRQEKLWSASEECVFFLCYTLWQLHDVITADQ